MAVPSASEINAALLSDRAWSGSQVTFSFPTATSSWLDYAAGSEAFQTQLQGLNDAQKAQLRLAFAEWDKLIVPSLTETSDPGQIRVAFTGLEKDTEWGHAYYPGSSGRAGDIWIDHDRAGAPFTTGTYDYMASMHEIGHALGLKHPFEEGATLADAFDTHRYTIMSYDRIKDSLYVKIASTGNGSIQTQSAYVYPTTPMLFDIAAIQARYGADPTTHAGATTWTFDESKPTFMTIYDAGGIDVIDLSGHSRPSYIDLTPGAFSSIDYYSAADQARAWAAQFPSAESWLNTEVFGRADIFTWSDNVAIAFNTVIENVRGGSGADRITGNDAANGISGGAGADTINGAAGDDYLRGEDGADSISGGAGFDDINGNRGADTIFGGEGNDWVVGGQDDDLLRGEDGDDIVYGNIGTDTCYGGAGNDWVRGGQGDDVLNGDSGADFISGDRGNDTIWGGGGADRFNLALNSEIDRVMDFNSAEGDRISIEGGGVATVTFTGGNTVIANANGDQLILMGVADAQTLGTWLFI